MKRRTFLGTAASGASVALLNSKSLMAKKNAAYLRLHPFIEANPNAVFIKITNVSSITDFVAKKNAGSSLTSEIFTGSDTQGQGIPITNQIALKPNITRCAGEGTPAGRGMLTEPYFMEGMIEGLKTIGIPASNMHMRDGAILSGIDGIYAQSDYPGVGSRTGINTNMIGDRDLLTLPDPPATHMSENTEIIHKPCPDTCTVFTNIAYLYPFNAPATWTISVAKFKAHGMGITLNMKNLQGTTVPPHMTFCGGFQTELSSSSSSNPYRNYLYQADLRADRYTATSSRVALAYKKHLADGVPRWDRPSSSGVQSWEWNCGLGMEFWAQRTLDNYSLSKPNIGLAMIEGITGRNGNGFLLGPGPAIQSNPLVTAEEFLTNYIIFGKDAVLVDMVGTWLAGHEPSNFGLFHGAKDRGFIDLIDVHQIPLYRWESSAPVATTLDEMTRYPLKTYYLQRNYNGQNEDFYHMVNEANPFVSIIRKRNTNNPSLKFLGFKSIAGNERQVIFQYEMPSRGHVLLEVFDALGHRVDVLQNTLMSEGMHAASWNTARRAAGTYYCRFKTSGFSVAEAVTIMR